MGNFRKGQVGIARYLKINNILPISVTQDSHCDVEETFFDKQK